MALETSAESPVPVRTVLQLVGGWIGRLGRVWVEGQIAESAVRGGAVFLTLRDPVAAVSVRVICTRQVFDAAQPAPAEGARVVIWARPDFNANRGSFALTALEIRAVGVGELLARLERLRRQLASEGLFSSERKRLLPFLPRVIGLICGRDSA
ncbi:MAG TPA: exodeoxyribonuclease VII large subunit, partial [Streptosporangiaceae bacterium]|nr:exodeoxyribonuclease VII large subunit [Streptosporangiaceae bacterium]